ncbi:anthranilate synthase component I [bacterium F11]|nr:anthranilate synthase component I [bacterium F11]
MKERIYPTLAEFKKLAKKGNLIPVGLDMMADRFTPVSLLASQWKKNSHCFLLESVEGGENVGRYSIVSFEPSLILEEKDGGTEFKTPKGQLKKRIKTSALNSLKNYLKQTKPVQVPGMPRFFGGAVGYCSYETIHELERLPKTNPDNLKWPNSLFFLTGDLFVFDNTQQILKILTCVRIKNKRDISKAYRRAKNKIKANLALLRQVTKTPETSHRKKKGGKVHEFVSNVNQKQFAEGVEKAKDHIRKGDIIQVVLSRRNDKKTPADPLDIYRALRVVNPSPYMYLIKMKNRAIIGSSPESLVRLEEGEAMTRPIAGTRPRGSTPYQDMKMEKDLLRDPKENAEHIMLVDLGRNDLGRVCQYGSIRLPKFMIIERYSHVMHIVSEVTGKMNEGKGCFDLLKAVFPAGTVSGAPKIRAMEIIDELENEQRGPYAGAVGYISFSGNMDMAITIRTILWENNKVSIQTGAGIVADSHPVREFDETENKAAGLKETIRLAEDRELFWERS